MVSTNAAIAMEKRSGYMPLTENRIYTIDDIENLPEGERAELIDGKIYYMSSPRYIHQKLLMELSTEIHNYIKTKGGFCEVLPAPFAVFINKDRHNYVDPERNRVLVYNFETEELQDCTFADSVKAGIHEDFYIDFSEIPLEM